MVEYRPSADDRIEQLSKRLKKLEMDYYTLMRSLSLLCAAILANEEGEDRD